MLSCSKSGYYDWVNLGRPKYKAFNESCNQIVLDTYSKNNTWGVRQLHMQIKKLHNVTISKSKIYRYMQINNIKSITRKRTHRYSKIQHHTIPNLIKRNFNAHSVNEKWSIDNFIYFCERWFGISLCNKRHVRQEYCVLHNFKLYRFEIGARYSKASN